MTFDDLVMTDYGMVGRIGSIEDVDGVTYYTVYFDDGAVNIDAESNSNLLVNIDASKSYVFICLCFAFLTLSVCFF